MTFQYCETGAWSSLFEKSSIELKQNSNNASNYSKTVQTETGEMKDKKFNKLCLTLYQQVEHQTL